MSHIHLVHDEQTPLLSGQRLPYEGEDDKTSIAHETRILLKLSLPLAAMNCLRFAIQGSTVFFVASLGTRELAASNLGLLSANILGHSLIIGLVGSLDSLANQAALSRPKMTSVYCMRAFVVCLQAMPIIVLLMMNTYPLFLRIMPHAEKEMLRLASDYTKVSALAIPPLAGFECIRRYLQALGSTRGPAYAYIIAAPVSVLLNWLLVKGPDSVRLGFLGAPLASSLSYWLLFLILLCYAYCAGPRHAWAGVSWAIVQDLGEVWRFGLAGILSTCSEWYAFEAIALGATYLGQTEQATTAVFGLIGSACWQIPLSISMAVSIRTGNLLGAGMPAKAKVAAWTSQLFSFIVVTVNAVLLLVFRHDFGTMFSNDPAVVTMIQNSIWVTSLVAVGDGIQGAASGVLRGCGMPGMAAKVNLVSYWVLGLPLGVLITYKTLDVAGLWSGLALAVTISASAMTVIILRTDWEECAREAVDRVTASDERAAEQGEEEREPLLV